MNILDALLPAQADNTIRGGKLPVYVFAGIAVVGAIGAAFICSLPMEARAALPGWIFRWLGRTASYSLLLCGAAFFSAFMYVLLILETLLRMLAGHRKPVTFAHTPPGAIGNYVILPLSVLMLALPFWKGKRA